MSAAHPQAPGDLLVFLGLLAGPAPGEQLLEIRFALPNGRMGRCFQHASDLERAASLIARLARRADVYVGVALREAGKGGGNAAINGSHLLYIECDHTRWDLSTASQALAVTADTFSYLPSLEIASGTPGHLHLYWRLHEVAASSEVEAANRRLACLLGGDLKCVGIARILRPPATLNYKHDPPHPVTLRAYREQERYSLAELTAGLPPDPQPAVILPSASLPQRVLGRTRLDRELAAIPTEQYVRVLAGLTPNRAGKVLCPFHQETTPSLHLYADGHLHCFGCNWHGWIIDFAAALRGVSTRGRDFLCLRSELARTFALADPQSAVSITARARNSGPPTAS